MKKKIILMSLLMASSAVLADQNLLEQAGKQTLKNAATSAAPKEAVEGVEATGKTLEQAKEIKGAVETAPAAVQDHAEGVVKEAVTEKVEAATPAEVKKGAEALKKANKLKRKIPTSTGEAAKAVEGKAKEKAAEKALDLLI